MALCSRFSRCDCWLNSKMPWKYFLRTTVSLPSDSPIRTTKLINNFITPGQKPGIIRSGTAVHIWRITVAVCAFQAGAVHLDGLDRGGLEGTGRLFLCEINWTVIIDDDVGGVHEVELPEAKGFLT
jgi:hypothetical protein